MAIKTFSVNEVLTASDTNTFLANAGLVTVIPSSVTNGSIISGTASATANSGAANVVVNGVFSSTYDSYRIAISNLTMSSTSAGTLIYLKMHDGTNPANSNYNLGWVRIDIAAVTLSAGSLNLANTGIIIGAGTGDKFGTTFDVVNPNIASHTIFPQISAINVSTGYSYIGAAMHQTSTAYTGFQLIPSSGTITGGVITVYGYRK